MENDSVIPTLNIDQSPTVVSIQARFPHISIQAVSSALGDIFSGEYSGGDERFAVRLNEFKRKDIGEILGLGLDEFINRLKTFSNPRQLCGFRHHFGAKIGDVFLTPEKCPIKKFNTSCGHPEINGMAIYLVVGCILTGRNFGDVSSIIFGLMRADELAQTGGTDPDILNWSQRQFSNGGYQLIQDIIEDLEN